MAVPSLDLEPALPGREQEQSRGRELVRSPVPEQAQSQDQALVRLPDLERTEFPVLKMDCYLK